MQVQIRGETKQLNVQTITLQPEKGEQLYAFHCLNCGNFMSKIGGKVSKIYPIYEPSDQVPVVNTCRTCKQEYNFQTHDGYSSDKIRVILNPQDITKYFYCYQGKDALLQYNNKGIFSVIDQSIKKTPFFSSCHGLGCKAIYYFTSFS